MDVQHFSTWCPKAIAGIGRIKDTTEDRSIIVTLERKPRSEAREHFNPDSMPDDLPRKFDRWAEDNLEPLAGYQRFDKLSNDRANDNWTPLIAIAGLAGEVWAARAAEAAHAMTQDQSGESMSFGEMLLNDIKALIEEKRLLKLRSAELVQELEGRPWAECGRQDSPLTANKLAMLLKPFKVYPRSIRFSDGVTRGYEACYFDEAFKKYTPPTPLSECNTATSPANKGDSSHSECNTECNSQIPGCNSATSEGADCSSVAVREESVAPCVAVQTTIKAAGSKACSSVAVQTGADGDFFSIESQPAAKSSPDLGDDDGEDEDLFAKLESGAVRA
jgi:putative DNA primase/helicase